jgi:hypothetical protein
LIEEGRCLIQREAQIGGAQLDQLILHAQAGQQQRRIRACEDDQMQRGQHMVEHTTRHSLMSVVLQKPAGVDISVNRRVSP